MKRKHVFKVQIISASRKHLAVWWQLRCKLWPKENKVELRREMSVMLKSRKEAALLAMVDNKPVGFIEMRLRDYAEGATTSPVGYIEGWYVLPPYRKQGIGRVLVQAGEQWAKRRGATEMGSDTWLWNTKSQKAHQRLGYEEVERLVVFHKKLK